MAAALEEILEDRFAGGVISTHALPAAASLSERWRAFAGGHPVPNEASLAAARASFELLREADKRAAPVVFLISGGGSAMLEWPREPGITLARLHEMNRVLVSCGARIAEINAVRRAVSAVKGGALAARAPHAPQVTLIISDTNRGEEANVASGPTLAPPPDAPDPSSVVARYQLAARLPASVLRAVNQHAEDVAAFARQNDAMHPYYVLLDNERAIECAARAARLRGYGVEIARDLLEQPVDGAAAALISRLAELRRRAPSENRAVCLISGGEFACPVRGSGVGGRNAETVLRCALEMDARAGETGDAETETVVLCAGTDGIDGNSPAAGALADNTTLTRARALRLDARSFLDRSDAHTFFQRLGDTIQTGPTGTNVRDLRILIKG
jgi:hydroxypyruvate reductase